MHILLAASGAEPQGGVALLLPDWAELIWGSVAFLLLLLLMSKLVFPRVNTLLEERRAEIEGKLEGAEAKLVEAEEARRRYEASIADARGEANRIVDEARTAAEAVRADIVARAEAEAAAMLERARADVAGERERVLQELRAQVGALSVQLAERIVERELDAATHGGLVDEYIERLAARN
jgi:F-type H+-transporting ATPase subunit b